MIDSLFIKHFSMEWFALLIPIFAIITGFTVFKRQFTIGELFLPLGIGLFLIFVCRIGVKHALVQDTEYWGSMVIEARYYEYWETWKKRTCSYTTTCCCNSKGQNCITTTHYYDCSYCDRNPAHWEAYDNAGNTWSISEQYYNYLKQKWLATPQFVELNRDIRHHNDCGKDGDMYRIRWDGVQMRSEAAVTLHTYTNKVQAAQSAFNLKPVTKREAKLLGLHTYPKLYDNYKQKVLLGIDSIYHRDSIAYFETLYQYFNGRYGKDNKIKLFVCLFYNKDISIATQQENYWSGGNQNELVVCIGLDRKTKHLDWVKPFSWTDQKRVLVDVREDVMLTGTFNPLTTYDAIHNAVSTNTMYKDFKKDFDYLHIPLPNWTLWLIYILVTVATIISFFWGLCNDIDNDMYQDERFYDGPIHRTFKYKLRRACIKLAIWMRDHLPFQKTI